MLFALQSTPSPNVEAHNAKGQSIQDLAAAAMSLSSDASSDDEPLAGPPPPAKRARLHHANTGSSSGPPDELDDESEWQARLREESGAELRGGDEEDWDRYVCMPRTYSHIVMHVLDHILNQLDACITCL